MTYNTMDYDAKVMYSTNIIDDVWNSIMFVFITYVILENIFVYIQYQKV